MVWAGNETTVPVFYWLNLKGQFCGSFIPRVSWMILWVLLLKHWWVSFFWSPSRYLNRFAWSFYAPLHFTCFELLGRLLTFSCTLWRFSHRAWSVVLWPRPILCDSTRDLQSMKNIVYRKASSLFCMGESGDTSICGKTQLQALVSIPAFHLSSSFHHLHPHRHLFSYTFGSKTNLSFYLPSSAEASSPPQRFSSKTTHSLASQEQFDKTHWRVTIPMPCHWTPTTSQGNGVKRVLCVLGIYLFFLFHSFCPLVLVFRFSPTKEGT